MNICIYDSEEQISRASAALIAAEVLSKPDCVLGLATGSTALTPYRSLIKMYGEKAVSFSSVTTFNLDEYCNLDIRDRNSYHSFMHDNLFQHIDIKEENTHFLDGNASDIGRECRDYEEKIKKAGGIDIQLLGIGSNGHIAFNEPDSHFPAISHQVALKESTIKDNARFFNTIEEVPTHALTMGIGSIMKARKILIIATGENKAEAVRAMVNGEVTPQCPASILRFHSHVTVMCDTAAAKYIK